MPESLWNLTTGELLAKEVELAHTFFRRAIGLLGRRDYPKGRVLWLEPCSSIHTFFMAFPIDVVFLDKHGVVLSVHFSLPPWRVAWHPKAFSVLEWKAPFLSPACISPGHKLGRKAF